MVSGRFDRCEHFALVHQAAGQDLSPCSSSLAFAVVSFVDFGGALLAKWLGRSGRYSWLSVAITRVRVFDCCRGQSLIVVLLQHRIFRQLSRSWTCCAGCSLRVSFLWSKLGSRNPECVRVVVCSGMMVTLGSRCTFLQILDQQQ